MTRDEFEAHLLLLGAEPFASSHERKSAVRRYRFNPGGTPFVLLDVAPKVFVDTSATLITGTFAYIGDDFSVALRVVMDDLEGLHDT